MSLEKIGFQNFKLTRPNRLCKRLIFADGIGSSGKGMTSHILSCFNNVEKQSNHTPFDYIAYIHWLEKIDDDAAVTYLQTEADQQLYHLFLGRDVNFRFTDSTGVNRNGRRLEYYRRLFLKEGDPAVARIKMQNPILNEAPHDALRSATLFFKAFDKLDIIYIVRDPFELILDWHRRGFGSRIGTDPREFQFNLETVGGKIIPMFFLNYPNLDYGSLTQIERLAVMIHFCMKTNLAGYQKLTNQQKDKVHFYSFNELVSNPSHVCQSISKKLGIEFSQRRLKRIYKQEKIPRSTSSPILFKEKVLQQIEKKAIMDVFHEIEIMYTEFSSLISDQN